MITWEYLIGTIAEWKADPAQLKDDEDRKAPTDLAFLYAITAIEALRSMQVRTPLRMIPNGEGGIIFEWKSIVGLGTEIATLEVDEKGRMELHLVKV